MKRQRGIPADGILSMRQSEMLASCTMKSTQTLLCGYSPCMRTSQLKSRSRNQCQMSPPVASPRTTIGTFSYVRGNEPPGTNTYGYRPFAGANPSGDHPPNHRHPAPPVRWVLPRHSAPPKAPTPPVPWVLTDRNIAPYDNFKPKILKEVDDFKGDSSDISRFFLKYELHFELFNRHFHYPPPTKSSSASLDSLTMQRNGGNCVPGS